LGNLDPTQKSICHRQKFGALLQKRSSPKQKKMIFFGAVNFLQMLIIILIWKSMDFSKKVGYKASQIYQKHVRNALSWPGRFFHGKNKQTKIPWFCWHFSILSRAEITRCSKISEWATPNDSLNINPGKMFWIQLLLSATRIPNNALKMMNFLVFGFVAILTKFFSSF
jgi:hypothetical protein